MLRDQRARRCQPARERCVANRANRKRRYRDQRCGQRHRQALLRRLVIMHRTVVELLAAATAIRSLELNGNLAAVMRRGLPYDATRGRMRLRKQPCEGHAQREQQRGEAAKHAPYVVLDK